MASKSDMQIWEEVKVELTIISPELLPDEISRQVGLSFDAAWRIGDPKGMSGLKWDKHGWRLFERETSSHEEQVTGELLERCFRRFSERLATFADKVRLLPTDCYIEVGVYMLSESIPPFSLDRDMIELIARLGATLDVDIILYEKK